MAKTTPPLTARERVILFCTATGVRHAAVGITAHAMQSMAIKGFIVHDRESGAYALTDSGRAALLAILGDAGACPQYATGNQRLGPALPSDSYPGNGGVCLTAALPRPGEGGRQSESYAH
jgi:hypothetical protein